MRTVAGLPAATLSSDDVSKRTITCPLSSSTSSLVAVKLMPCVVSPSLNVTLLGKAVVSPGLHPHSSNSIGIVTVRLGSGLRITLIENESPSSMV